MKKKKTIERIYLTELDFIKIENDVRYQEHLRRYAAVRRYCYGKVLDFACGCGYGSKIIAVNPEVVSVTSIDIDKPTIDWAIENFSHEKINFQCKDIQEVTGEFDTLISLETFEHIKDSRIFIDLVKRCNIDHVILSFPDKKSTHFNKHHLHDFVVQDVIDLFEGYILYYSFRSGDVQFMNFIKAPKNAPHHIFRNLNDLKIV